MAAKYSPKQALDLIRKILGQGGYFRPTLHCRRDSMPLRDVDDQDIAILLTTTGSILREPEWNEEHQNYVYRVEGLDESKDELIAVVAIDEPARIVVITVF